MVWDHAVGGSNPSILTQTNKDIQIMRFIRSETVVSVEDLKTQGLKERRVQTDYHGKNRESMWGYLLGDGSVVLVNTPVAAHPFPLWGLVASPEHVKDGDGECRLVKLDDIMKDSPDQAVITLMQEAYDFLDGKGELKEDGTLDVDKYIDRRNHEREERMRQNAEERSRMENEAADEGNGGR